VPLAELLDQVRGVTLGAYDHQGLPFEKIIEALRPERSLSRTPFFRVVCVLHNWPKHVMSMPLLTATIDGEVDEPAMIDLLLSLEERGNEITGSLYYSTELFDRETMQRWMACLRTLLAEMVDGAHRRIGNLEGRP
ncbi:MAG: condensation domain-containing protein, partial [Steroidobacteraceae bacterium]